MRDVPLPLGLGPLGTLIALPMAALVYLAILALAVALAADQQLDAAAAEPVSLDIELPAVDAGRAAADRLLVVMTLKGLPGLAAIGGDPGGAVEAVEPWLRADERPVPIRLSAAFAPSAASSADELARQLAAAGAPPGLRVAASADGAALGAARDARLLGAGGGAALLLGAVLVMALAAWALVRHCRATIEVLVGLGAGVARVRRAVEAAALAVWMRAAALALIAAGATLAANRWWPLLEAAQPLSYLRPIDLVLLALVPVGATLGSALAARAVTVRQLDALA